MPRSSMLDADARFQQFTPSRVPPPVGCADCGQTRLIEHRRNRDGSYAVTCWDCGRVDVRAPRGVAPAVTQAARQIVGGPLHYRTREECLLARPVTLTATRAASFLPKLEPNCTAKYTGGGLRQLHGALATVWPSQRPTNDEARWILSLAEFESWRGIASIAFGLEGRQDVGMHLVAAAKRVLGVSQ